MKIINHTQKKVLAEHASECRSLFAKATGLMFASKPKALLFSFSKPRKVSLHMFFVHFPIDVIYIEKGQVVEIKEHLKPWQMYTPKTKASLVLELPMGLIQKTKTRVGDEIIFQW